MQKTMSLKYGQVPSQVKGVDYGSFIKVVLPGAIDFEGLVWYKFSLVTPQNVGRTNAS